MNENHTEIQKVPDIENTEEIQKLLLKNIEEWLIKSRKKHNGTNWYGIHDEGTYLTSFREYNLLTEDKRVTDYAFEMFEKCDKWIQKNLPKGYWNRQEVHHGVEHFIIYLPWLLELDKNNDKVKAQLKNAANHIVRKDEKKKAWFDFSKNEFLSSYLGVKFTGKERVNVPEHLRLVRLAWLGLYSEGDPLLRDVIYNYSKRWAKEINNSEMIPLFLSNDAFSENSSSDKINKKLSKVYYKFTGAAPKNSTIEARSEVHIANGSPSLFIRLYEIFGETLFLDAAEQIVAPLVNQISYPYSHPLSDLITKLKYHNRLNNILNLPDETDIDIYCNNIQNAIIKIDPNVKWSSEKYKYLKNTIGMRNDMPEILIKFKDSNNYCIPYSPGLLTFKYRQTHNPIYLNTAMLFTNAVFSLYQRNFPDGRKHGCGSKSISACCIGHGRNWGSGYVSTTLRCLLDMNQIEITLPDF